MTIIDHQAGFDLLNAILRRALLDARRGDAIGEDARLFLDELQTGEERMIIESVYVGTLDIPARGGGRLRVATGERVEVETEIGKKLVAAERAIEVDSLQVPPKQRMQYVGRSGRWVQEISRVVYPGETVEVVKWVADRMLAGEIGEWKQR